MTTKTITLKPLHTGAPTSTLTISRRPWTSEERQHLARILFGPRPGDEHS